MNYGNKLLGCLTRGTPLALLFLLSSVATQVLAQAPGKNGSPKLIHAHEDVQAPLSVEDEKKKLDDFVPPFNGKATSSSSDKNKEVDDYVPPFNGNSSSSAPNEPKEKNLGVPSDRPTPEDQRAEQRRLKAQGLDSRFLNYTQGEFYTVSENERKTAINEQIEVTGTYGVSLIDAELALRDVIDFDLPNGETLRLIKDYLIERTESNYTWVGHLESDFGVAAFVVNQGRVTGQIDVGNTQYKLSPISVSTHLLYSIDKTLYEDEETPEANDWMEDNKPTQKDFDQKAPEEGGGNELSARSAMSGLCPVRILVAYTDDVRIALAGVDPRDEIQLAADYMNISNAFAGVNHQIELVRIMEVPYVEPAGGVLLSNFLPELRINGDGIMDAVHADRALFDADLVIGICQTVATINGGITYGLAYVGPLPYDYGFASSVYNRMAGPLTFPHELGHNFGALHDIQNDPTPGDNHGYINFTTPTWKTVMGTIGSCPTCPRQQFWSNPSVNYQGLPTGVVGESDNENTLNTNYAATAALEPTVPAKTVFNSVTVNDLEEGHFYGDVSLATISNPLVYESGSEGRLEATDSIMLRPGFHAKAGTNVVARLKNCMTMAPRPLARNRVQHGPVVPLAEEGLAGLQGFGVYPNPSRVGAPMTIRYTLEVDAFTSIEVYGIDGRHVETIRYQPSEVAGEHQLQWNAPTLTAGEYFVIMRSGDQQFQQKLILMD